MSSCFKMSPIVAAKKSKPKQNDIMEDYELDNQNDNDAMDDYSAEDDNLPRVDISGQITESLLNELADKNWKVRTKFYLQTLFVSIIYFYVICKKLFELFRTATKDCRK